MPNAKIENYVTKVKAAHKYEVIGIDKTDAFAGKKIHFIGIGGVGMSGLAKLLMGRKAIVSGSDQADSDVVEKLLQSGADIKIGQAADNLGESIDAVVISAAIKEENPELKHARTKACRVYKYAEMLGELMGDYDGIAISGTHGKSTTTGWLSFALRQAGIDAGFLIGADAPQLNGSSGTGKDKYFVAEACEYDRSFLNLKPQIGCVLNIEQDHLDYYSGEQEIVEAFEQFASGIRPFGVLVANGTDKNVAKVIKSARPDIKCETFGLGKNCDFTARNIQLIDGLYNFDVYYRDQLLGRTHISLPGLHNVVNALAVVSIGLNCDLAAETILRQLPKFSGIDRRLMLKDKIGGITVIDDYAHHPSEIRASLASLRQRYQPKRIWCVFQPHQYSRTRFLLDDFAQSFKLADVTIVPEIYFVRDVESDKKVVNSQLLVERIAGNGSKAVFVDGFGKICEYLKKRVRPGEMVVTMGAGDVWKVADEYIQRLRENC